MDLDEVPASDFRKSTELRPVTSRKGMQQGFKEELSDQSGD
jgi:hypothetical protein